MHLLLVEDDPVLANGLMHSLQLANFTVTHEANGQRADHWLTVKCFDLLILDLGLPDMDGTEILSRLRQRGNLIPVLLLTARNSLTDRVHGLDGGADDYLAKPFELQELEARIRALLRRSQPIGHARLEVGGLCLDMEGQCATLNQVPLDLLARELNLLKILMQQAGRVISKDVLCEQLSSAGEEISSNAVEVYVHRLRKKIESGGVSILTLRGLGYMLALP
ncbi:response regulator transcription factor [Gallionella capsiferriformans]|jgi:two-component system OmpR family response regulator|uniref:Two component transcriptional regulator, winged helix family n=1 Tax=Gallionella capsiferriformans (strain ES-2) TaxID=395494 RepID=D9SGQ6_GALCS|nr:response regulator transcription factor [Gallionella capsiferriformans]ADL55703.1 two component transcriptional regulator, winged helix family [Gallionella capsiferriformans ES-2]